MLDPGAEKGVWETLEHRLRGYSSRVLSATLDFCKRLDEIEMLPLCVTEGECPFGEEIDAKMLLEAGIALEEELAQSSAYPILQARNKLSRRLVALRYRMGLKLGGAKRSAWKSVHGIDHIEKLATEWKRTQVYFVRQDLLDEERRRIHTIARYPLFVALLFEDETLTNHLFEWVLRDGVDPDVFVQYPKLSSKLLGTNLAMRIGRYPGHLKITYERRAKKLYKAVTLPFEGRRHSLLDETQEIALRGGVKLALSQILEVFSAKNLKVGDLEYLAAGVSNWNAHLLGWWNASTKKHHCIDPSAVEWWWQLPEVERLSMEKIREVYDVSLDGEEWAIAICATRTTPTLSPDASHAYVEVLIPLRGGKQYQMFPMGKFATTYAGSLFQSLTLFTATLEATVMYPDENIFYSHRQLVRFTIPLSKKLGAKWMRSISRDLMEARRGVFTYQVESENCAKWLHDKMEEVLGKEHVPDLFQVAMLDTEPPGLAQSLFDLLKNLPKHYHSPVLSLLHYPLGAWRGKWIEVEGEREWRSITTTKFWQDKVCYIPAKMHEQYQSGWKKLKTAKVLRKSTLAPGR